MSLNKVWMSQVERGSGEEEDEEVGRAEEDEDVEEEERHAAAPDVDNRLANLTEEEEETLRTEWKEPPVYKCASPDPDEIARLLIQTLTDSIRPDSIPPEWVSKFAPKLLLLSKVRLFNFPSI